MIDANGTGWSWVDVYCLCRMGPAVVMMMREMREMRDVEL